MGYMYFDAAANYHIYQLPSITRKIYIPFDQEHKVRRDTAIRDTTNVFDYLIRKHGGVSEMLRVIKTSYEEDWQVGISQASLLGPLFYHYL